MSVDSNSVLRIDSCIQRLWHLQADEVSRMMELPLFGEGPFNESSLSVSDQIEFKRVLESLSVINETLSILRSLSDQTHASMSPEDEVEYRTHQMDAFGSLTLYSVRRI